MLQDALFTQETTRRRSGAGARAARRAVARGHRRGAGAAVPRAAAVARGHSRSRPGRLADRARIAAATRAAAPRAATIATAAPRPKPGKPSPRHGMAEGSVWFRAAIGRQKNAEARWLLPMICRRGGIDKHDIGAIRILDTTTEFEISERPPPNPSPPRSGVPTRKTTSASRRWRKRRRGRRLRRRSRTRRGAKPASSIAARASTRVRATKGPRSPTPSPMLPSLTQSRTATTGRGRRRSRGTRTSRLYAKPDSRNRSYDKGAAAKPFNKKPKKKFRAPA